MKKILIIVGVVAVIAIMIILNVVKANNEDGNTSFGGSKAVPVTVKTITKGDLSSSIIITGTVEEVNKKDLIGTSSMKITGVSVKEGDKVNVGDTLFTIDTSSASDELNQLKLNREIQALQIEKIKSVSSTSSASGAKIAVELAKLNLASAESTYNNQSESLAKNEELFNEGIISASEYESLTKAVNDATSQIEIAKLNLERSESDLNQIYSANSTSSKSLEFDVEIQLKNLESLDLNIIKAEKQLQEMTDITKATQKGTITTVNVEVGDTVMPNVQLLQIIDMDNLIIKASVREYDIRDMKLEQDVVITGDAIPKEDIVTGKISYISPVAKELVINGRQTKGIEIEIKISKGSELLKPGYTTDCEVTTNYVKNVVVASYELFSSDKDDNQIVFVVNDGVLEKRLIETGIVSDFDSEITSGLNEGDIVVVNPSLVLKDGMKVSISKNLDESENVEKEGE